MTKQHDEGFSLIELLLVIVVLGILAVVVVSSIGGFRAEAEDASCEADAHILATSTEAYFAQHRVQAIPDADGSLDGHERTLGAEGFLRSPSALYDLDAAGQLVQVADSPCTV